MVRSMDEVLQNAMALPVPERVELVEALIATFAPEDAAPLDDAWLAEIDRRSDDFDSGRVQPIAWFEVKERARRRAEAHE